MDYEALTLVMVVVWPVSLVSIGCHIWTVRGYNWLFSITRPKLIGRQSHLKLSMEVAEEITIFNILMEERSFYVVETKIRVTQ